MEWLEEVKHREMSRIAERIGDPRNAQVGVRDVVANSLVRNGRRHVSGPRAKRLPQSEDECGLFATTQQLLPRPTPATFDLSRGFLFSVSMSGPAILVAGGDVAISIENDHGGGNVAPSQLQHQRDRFLGGIECRLPEIDHFDIVDSLRSKLACDQGRNCE